MPDVVEADAPGRVNLIGEHTDYHQGYVLPTIIPQRTRVHLTGRSGRRIRASSAEQGGRWEDYTVGEETPGRGWLDYIQGVTVVLGRTGERVPAFDVRIDSDIPVGAGVSSSAALTVSLLRGLRALTGLHIDDVLLAKMAQAVETDFVGAPVGVMDPMACSLGRADEALFLDTRTLDTQRVPLPPSVELLVIDSGVKHQHATGAYATRRRESFEAASLLGLEHLRDLGHESWGQLDALPPTLARRARHIVTENQRVLDAVAALRASDTVRLGQLMADSHVSMRDDYEISTPDVDALVAIGREHPDVFGARMTGGGFGGAVVLVAKAGAGRGAARAIRDRYMRQRGRQATVLVPPDAQQPVVKV
jgi:galactokinase